MFTIRHRGLEVVCLLLLLLPAPRELHSADSADKAIVPVWHRWARMHYPQKTLNPQTPQTLNPKPDHAHAHAGERHGACVLAIVFICLAASHASPCCPTLLSLICMIITWLLYQSCASHWRLHAWLRPIGHRRAAVLPPTAAASSCCWLGCCCCLYCVL